MNESEQDRLQILVKDDFLLSIVRKLFFAVIEKNKPDVSKDVDNDVLGEKYRAYKEAEKIIDECFRELLNQKQADKITRVEQFSRGR